MLTMSEKEESRVEKLFGQVAVHISEECAKRLVDILVRLTGAEVMALRYASATFFFTIGGDVEELRCHLSRIAPRPFVRQ